MSTPSPSMRNLALRLLEATRSATSPSGSSEGSRADDTVEVCERLRSVLSRFAGPDGFSALLRRALSLARVEAPALHSIRLGEGCQMEGLEEVAASEGGSEAAVALAAHLLELLVVLIGEPLTLRLVREGWHDIEIELDDAAES